MSQPKIKACLFDMDGLLIDSEEVYTRVSNELLAKHGRPPMPFEVKAKLQGLPGPRAAATFLEWAQIPYTPEELYEATVGRQKELWHEVNFMPGAKEIIHALHEAEIPIALATSSHKLNYDRKTSHIRPTFDLFGPHVIVGDDERIPDGRGKPAPDIYLLALASLNEDRAARGLDPIKPHECLVFEDGVPGVRAGQAAGCHVAWVPDPRVYAVLEDDLRNGLLNPTDYRFESLEHVDIDHIISNGTLPWLQ
ncbi:hypothetical protein CANCADRAFT_30691 [Tortispora caseinolytica NRRL Y-17796]|uniref:Uncharacterized protein n=1 Tax=Tortispora caseinolytica NRRL Y-17796 TaxID=767744 RepID=A0A1E4TLC2_9ASCO|nr:hypothetical protein CANCADRAFT_30691 [Tortispora caseinolytica NRRL Y-17796]